MRVLKEWGIMPEMIEYSFEISLHGALGRNLTDPSLSYPSDKSREKLPEPEIFHSNQHRCAHLSALGTHRPRDAIVGLVKDGHSTMPCPNNSSHSIQGVIHFIR